MTADQYILGSEKVNFGMIIKVRKLNAIRTRTAIEQADIVIVRFGEKYKQWNAALMLDFSAALSKPLIIVIHQDENQHALKEIDASALCSNKK